MGFTVKHWMSSAIAIKENNNKNNNDVKNIIKYEHWASLKKDVEDTLSGWGFGVLAGGRGRLHLLRVGELREQTSHKVLPTLVLLPPVDEHLVLSGPTETGWKHNTTQVAHSSGCSVSSLASRRQRYGEDSWNFFLKKIRWAEVPVWEKKSQCRNCRILLLGQQGAPTIVAKISRLLFWPNTIVIFTWSESVTWPLTSRPLMCKWGKVFLWHFSNFYIDTPLHAN